MDNVLDILLRELYNHTYKEIYITQAYHKTIIHFKMIPIMVKYDTNGIGLQDKDGYGIIIDDSAFEITMDNENNCLSFAFRDKSNEVYYTICF